MIQAILLLLKRGRHPQEQHHIGEVVKTSQPHVKQRVAGAKILKHEVFRRGPMLECLRCGQFWESTASSYVFSGGICPGPKIYGQPQKDRPWVIPACRGPIWWGRSKLNKSHRAAWYKGVLYCSQCGHLSLKGQSLTGLGKRCQVNSSSTYCQVTMKLIQHGTNRAGFKDWPTYDNKPGPEEPQIARCAIPDPEWIKEPPPRTYNKNKTVTGEKLAEKEERPKISAQPYWENQYAKVVPKN